MSIKDAWFDPKCQLAIHDVDDEETWVRCAKSKSQMGLFVIPIVVIVMMLIIAFASLLWKIIAFLVGVAVIGFIIFGYKMGEVNARVDYQTFSQTVERRMKDTGKTRGEVIAAMRDENIRTAQAYSSDRAAKTIAAAMMVGNTMRRKNA